MNYFHLELPEVMVMEWFIYFLLYIQCARIRLDNAFNLNTYPALNSYGR